MRVLDLFSGIGGFSLGLDRAGMETVAFCEIEKYPRSILKKHWTDVPRFRDIRKLNKKVLDNAGIHSIELICGGFPCQPFSVAGKQGGKEDDRHLCPEMFRLIKEIKPTWVIGENVAGFISMALDDVLSDLESEGYQTQTFVIPACAVGGIHRRDRVWIVANTDNQRKLQQQKLKRESRGRTVDSSKAGGNVVADSKCRGRSKGRKQTGWSSRNEVDGRDRKARCALADSHLKGLQRQPVAGSNEEVGEKSSDKLLAGQCCSPDFEPIGIPNESTVRHRDDGLPDNVARLKALGNAVVPQIPEMIGRAIMEIENATNED